MNKLVKRINFEDGYLTLSGSETVVIHDGTELVTYDNWQNYYKVYHEVKSIETSDVEDKYDNSELTIKELRYLTGLSQEKFASKYKIPLRTLQSWESEERVPAEYISKFLKRIMSMEKILHI